MGRGWCFLLVLVACYAPIPPQGAPCDPEIDNCPSGQRCVRSGPGYACLTGDGNPIDGALDAPLDAPEDAPLDTSAADLDGDGVLNADDNCPTTVNADQHDEDADLDTAVYVDGELFYGFSRLSVSDEGVATVDLTRTCSSSDGSVWSPDRGLGNAVHTVKLVGKIEGLATIESSETTFTLACNDDDDDDDDGDGPRAVRREATAGFRSLRCSWRCSR